MLTELKAGVDPSHGIVALPVASEPPTPRASRMESDELDGIVSAVCARYPDCPRSDVETLVTDAFQYLKAGASVTAHLIPLTLNRSLRLMRESRQRYSDRLVKCRSDRSRRQP